MSTTPEVSVVIATYNYGHFLSKAVDSALAQTFRDFEIIVIDDASTDDTPEMMKSYADRGLVKYHRIEHRGATGAKNDGGGPEADTLRCSIRTTSGTVRNSSDN